MAVSKKQRHLSPEVLYDFLKGGLAGNQLEWVQTHLASCPRCAALAARGRLVMKWLRNWSVQSQNLACCRVLLQDALARALTQASSKKILQRLSAWRRGEPAQRAALFSLTSPQAGHAHAAKVAHLKRLTRALAGLKIAAARSPSGALLSSRLNPSDTRKPSPQPGPARSLIEIEPQDKGQLLIRGKFAEMEGPAPLVLLMSCRHRATPSLKPLHKTPGQKGWLQTRFTGLEPGRYILAVEPVGISPSAERGFPQNRQFP